MARSFTGDKKQMQAILKTAIAHNGLSIIDVVSPCMTFNDHEGSTKSYSYMKEHEEPLHELDFVPYYEEIPVEIPEGEVAGSDDARRLQLRLHKLGRDYDPTDKWAAKRLIHGRKRRARSRRGSCTWSRTRRASWITWG